MLKATAVVVVTNIIIEVLGAIASLVDQPPQLETLINLFIKMHEEGQVSDEEGKIVLGSSWEIARAWSSVVGTTGILILVGYLL